MRIILFALILCLNSGCAFYRNVLVSEDGTVAPWYSNRDDKEYLVRWKKDREVWEIKNASTRYRAGQIDRATYDRIRKQHGLSAED